MDVAAEIGRFTASKHTPHGTMVENTYLKFRLSRSAKIQRINAMKMFCLRSS